MRARLAAVAAIAVALAGPAHAAGTGGCESFAFPLATELAWMTAAEAEAVASGAELPTPPDKAMLLALKPTPDVKLTVPARQRDGDPPPGDVHAGTITFAAAREPGLTQVSLAERGWIEVVQDGKALATVAHTGKSDCPGLRKSVRFEVGPGPFTVEVSGVKAGSIKVTVRRAD